jgi:hypothetical protein
MKKDPDLVLRSPYIPNYVLGADLLRRVVEYFSKIFRKRSDAIEKYLPKSMFVWTRMRIRHNGDHIRTASWIRKHRQMVRMLRNNSYIRVSFFFI